MSFTRRIRCGSCGHEGLIEAHDTTPSAAPDTLFSLLGKDPGGFFHVRCPACHRDLAVDPMKVLFLGTGTMIGHESHVSATSSRMFEPTRPIGLVVLRWALTLAVLVFGLRGVVRVMQGRATFIDFILAGGLAFLVVQYFRTGGRAERV